MISGKSLDIDLNGHQRRFAVCIYFKRGEMHSLNGGITLAAQFNGTPDADGWQARSPIPAVAKLRLAHHDSFGVVPPVLEWSLLDLLEWRVKTERERIGPVGVQTMTDIKNCLAKHVLVPAQFLTIEPDGSKRVQPLENQQQSLILAQRHFFTGEADAIPPFSLFHPGACVFVSIIKRIFDTTSRHQCLMHIPRGWDVDPITRIKLLSKYLAGNSLSRREIL